MTEFFKSVRPDGGSFNDPGFMWATEPGGITEHPDFRCGSDGPAHYLSVSTVVTDCTGFGWPARLLIVEPVDESELFTPDAIFLPNKRAAGAFRTVREEPAHLLLGPQGELLVELFDSARALTLAQTSALAPAWDATRVAALGAARDAAGNASRDAVWVAALTDAGDAAAGLALRDLVGTGAWTQEAYDTLTERWRTVVGKLHPDDPDLR